MRWLMSMMVVLPLLLGGRNPEPEYPSLRDCPFAVDPNLIVGKFLGCLRLTVGQDLVRTLTWHDAEGDPADVELLAAPKGVQLVNKPRTSSYTLLWTPKQPMTAAIVVRVTDKPRGAQPQSETGTIVVQVVASKPLLVPKGCGGQP
jgi:hypothetical protein